MYKCLRLKQLIFAAYFQTLYFRTTFYEKIILNNLSNRNLLFLRLSMEQLGF